MKAHKAWILFQEVIETLDIVPTESWEKYLDRMRISSADKVLTAYRQVVAKKDEALEKQMLEMIRARTDFKKADWQMLLHGSPNGSLLAALAREKLGLPN